MKYALVTRADENIKEMTDISHPLMKKYAEKIGADFIIIDDPKGLHIHYRIMQFYELFEKYDRIISMDSDVIITPDCPNIFDEVPEDEIGTVFEDVGSRTTDRRLRIRKAQEKFGIVGWSSGYINTGNAVFSKCHKPLFAPSKELYMDLGFDDVYLGYWIHKLGYKIHQLDSKWNFMQAFGEIEGFGKRFDAYVIHYAGQGGFIAGFDRVAIMQQDYNVFYGDGIPFPEMKNKQIIDLIGNAESIADVGCGEGFLTRYLKKHYPKVIPIDIKDNNRVGLKDVVLWDIQDDPPKGLLVDIVIASEVLEHIDFWKDALRNLLKITKNKLIITIPYGQSFLDPGHKNFWDDETIIEIGNIALPYQTIIKKGITKPEDVKNNQLLYFIEIKK